MTILLCLCLSFAPQAPADRWFAEDKALHFASSFAATTLSASLGRMAGLEPRKAVYAGVATSGLIGNFGQANYMAAKMGIVGLSRGIALDMQRFGVRSNCIAPFAWSRMISSIPTETEAEKARVEKLKRMTPEKIAPLVAFLGSDAARDVSGQIFAVRNNEIFLMSQSRPQRVIHRGDGWTPEAIAEMLPGALGPSLVPLERSTDVFSWDPV